MEAFSELMRMKQEETSEKYDLFEGKVKNRDFVISLGHLGLSFGVISLFTTYSHFLTAKGLKFMKTVWKKDKMLIMCTLSF